MKKKLRSKLRRQSKESIAKLQRRLWVYCKLITRKVHGNECYTCGEKNLEGSNWHTGHMIAKAACGANLKYDLRILRPQCSVCNLWRGGMGAEFVRNMIIREGQEYVDGIFADKNITLKNAHEHYLMLAEKYKLMIQDLKLSVP